MSNNIYQHWGRISALSGTWFEQYQTAKRLICIMVVSCSILLNPLYAKAANGEKESSEPLVIKESDYHARKEKEEKERQIYGNGLSVSEIIEYTSRARARLRKGQHVDVTKKFKRYSSIMREVRKNYIRVLNLEGANFSGDNMSRTNFSMSNLEGANFSSADLSESVFAYTDLSDANFAGANLRGADFSHADLEGVDFSGAKLSGANFYRANIKGVKTATAGEEKVIKESVEYYRVNKSY